MPANPLAPQGPRRRHPKMLPDGARDKLLEAVHSARDRLVVTWLGDGGVGSASCVGCTWSTYICVRALRGAMPIAAPACLSPPEQPERRRGQDQTSVAGRKRHRVRWTDQACQPRNGPHLFRLHHHRIPAWVNRSRDAAGAATRRRCGPAVGAGGGARDAVTRRQARRAGSGETACVSAFVHLGGTRCRRRQPGDRPRRRGWASAAMVDEIYGHVDVHDPAFDTALRTAWGEV